MAVFFVSSLPSLIPSYSSWGPFTAFFHPAWSAYFPEERERFQQPWGGIVAMSLAGKWVKPGSPGTQWGCLGGDQRRPWEWAFREPISRDLTQANWLKIMVWCGTVIEASGPVRACGLEGLRIGDGQEGRRGFPGNPVSEW